MNEVSQVKLGHSTDVVGGYLTVPCIQQPSDEEDLSERLKVRQLRRLRDQWRCKIEDHTYCFVDIQVGVHVQLTSDNLEQWANTIHDGYATLLVPPENVVPHRGSHSNPTPSTATWNTITYQRPFHVSINPSLTDIRSCRRSLSSDTSSSASSIAPGIGYLSGKAINWVGETILEAITPFEIQRRIWVIRRLIKRMEKEPAENRRLWIAKKHKSLYRLVEDLLELSSDDYNVRHQETSRVLGSHVRRSLLACRVDAGDITYWVLSLMTLALDFLHENDGSVDSLGVSMRELLLQELPDMTEMGYTIAELVSYACNKLFHGSSSLSQRQSLILLYQLHRVPDAKRELDRLGQTNSGILRTSAEKLFSNEIENYELQAHAIRFFAWYANDHHVFRKYVLSPNGLAFVSHLTTIISGHSHSKTSPVDWTEVYWVCRGLSGLSFQPWAIPTLLEQDICSILLRLLGFYRTSDRPNSWIDYYILYILHNVATHHEGFGRRAICDAMTSGLHTILENLGETSWPLDWMNIDMRSWIADVLGTCR